jgi:plasmid stability protein
MRSQVISMTVIELPDDQAAALKAKASSEGLTLEAWFKKLAEEQLAEAHVELAPLQTAADIVLGHMGNVPPEIMVAMPKDGAAQHDHYIYGWPKKEA